MTKPVTSEILDRDLPADLGAERAVIGSMLLDSERIDDVASILRAEDFYDQRHRLVYQHLTGLHGSGQPIDVKLLDESLSKAIADDGHAFGDGGPASMLAEILRQVPTAAHAIHYARIVHAKAGYRNLIHGMTDALRDAYDEAAEPDELCTRLEQKLAHIADAGRGDDSVDADVAMDQALDRAREVQQHGRPGGLCTGLGDFDALIGGLFPGELIVLAARPRIGKTSLALQIAAGIARSGERVLFVSLEMSAMDLCSRILCAEAGVDNSRIRTGRLNDGDLASLTKAREDFRDIPLHISDRGGVTVADVRRMARRIQRKHGLSLLVIDYLGLLAPADRRIKRYEQVGQMSHDLKRLAGELSVPVLVLAQLNREIESAGNHRPRLSHLRESGDIEQDADVVMFLHRAEVFKPTDPDLRGKAELIVEKNRNGVSGKFDLLWLAETTQFWTPARDCESEPWSEPAPRQGQLLEKAF